MPQFSGFLDALGQAFGGYAQDQQRRAKSEDDDFSRDFQLRQAGYMPTQTPGVGALTAPLHGGAQAYAFDYAQSPQGRIEARQTELKKQQDAADAAKRTLQNKRAYGTLRTQFSADPASTDDYSDDLDYAAALKEAQAAARDARKPQPFEAQKAQAIRARVQELVAGGADLETANRKARLESGETVGEAPGPTITVLPGADGRPAQGVVTHGPGVGTAMAIPEVDKTGTGGGGIAAQTQQARLLAAVSEARLADERMREYEKGLLGGTASISPLKQAAGSLTANLADSHGVFGALTQAGAEFGLNKSDPGYAQYLRDAATIGRAEQMMSPRGGNETMARANALLSRAGTGAMKNTIEASQMARQALFGQAGGVAQALKPEQNARLNQGVARIKAGETAPVAAPAPAPVAPPAPSSGRPPLADRVQQLKASGLSKEQARLQLRREGYDLSKGM